MSKKQVGVVTNINIPELVDLMMSSVEKPADEDVPVGYHLEAHTELQAKNGRFEFTAAWEIVQDADA